MTNHATKCGATAPEGLRWEAVPYEAAKERLVLATMKSGAGSIAITAVVWLEVQTSAQKLRDGGRFEISRVFLARDLGVDLAMIDAIFAAFAEVGLIADGKLATYCQMQSRDQKHREKKKKVAVSEPSVDGVPKAQAPLLARMEDHAARVAEPSEIASSATRSPVSASRSATESSESSSTTIDSIEDPPSSSSGEAASATTMTDGEIFSKIVEAVDGRIRELVIRRGIGTVRRWIETGYDFEHEILPELAEVSANLKTPLSTLSAAFIAAQLANRRDERLAQCAAAPASAPAPELPTPRPPPRSYRPTEDFEAQACREILNHG